MKSALQLPADIYCQIFSHVHASTPATLLSASLASRELCKLSRRYLYRNISFDIRRFDRCQYVLNLLKSSEEIQGFVKEIACTGRFYSNDSAEVKENLNSLLVGLESCIKESPRMQLASFSWNMNTDTPSTLLELVDSKFPRGTISIENYTGTPLPLLATLSSLSAEVHIHHDPLHNFQPILLASPSLRNLHISAYQQRGCGIRQYPAPPYLHYDPARACRPADYPPLMSLRLEYFSFSKLDDILTCMNWSNIRTLHIHEGDGRRLLEALTPASRAIPLLEVFTFRKWYIPDEEQHERCYATLRGFLDSAAALRTVQLEGPFTRLCRFVAERHGPMLEVLGFHCPEMTAHKTFLTMDDLVLLGRCQHLRELIMDVGPEFDVPAMESWEDVQGVNYMCLSELINSMEMFRVLKRLTVWGELGLSDGHGLMHGLMFRPLMLRPGGSDAFSDVREQCAAIVDPTLLSTTGETRVRAGKLESMTVCFGEDRIVPGRPANWVFDEQRRASRSFIERVEGHERIALKVQKEEPLRYRPNPHAPAPRRRWVVDHQGVWLDDER